MERYRHHCDEDKRTHDGERITKIKSEREKERREYLLPSIRTPGSGLPLNMVAAHPKGRG